MEGPEGEARRKNDRMNISRAAGDWRHNDVVIHFSEAFGNDLWIYLIATLLFMYFGNGIKIYE